MRRGTSTDHGDRSRLSNATLAERIRAWGLAVGWLTVIYCTIPLVYAFVYWSYRVFSREWYPRAVAGILFLAGAYVVVRLFHARRTGWRVTVVRVGFLVLSMGTILVFMGVQEPVAKVHVVQYGLLALLFLRALRLDVHDWTAYPTALVFAACGGLGDELIQGFLPERVGELLDVRLNVYAALLALGFAALLEIGRATPWPRPWRASWDFLCGAFLSALLLLFVFFATNPDLRFGHRHAPVGEPTFQSLLTIPELAAADAGHAARSGPSLTQWYQRRTGDFRDVLDDWQGEGRIDEETARLFWHVFLHQRYRDDLMFQGRVADAWREHWANLRAYQDLVWGYRPRWDEEVLDRLRGLLGDREPEPPLVSDYLPDATPVYDVAAFGGRFVARAPLPAARVAAVILEHRRDYYVFIGTAYPREYGDFLEAHPAGAEPFLRELRVHLFRRNRYALLGQYDVALGENRILETYFGKTLAVTPWQWDAESVARMRALVPDADDAAYRSPVGEEYYVTISRGGIELTCLALAVIVLFLWRCARRGTRTTP